MAEFVCAVEPTETDHETLAQCLEAQGADVVLVPTRVAHHHRQTLVGTWGTSAPQAAHTLGDLRERGPGICSSRPDAPVATVRRLVRLLRHARGELGACQPRCRHTILPWLGPAADVGPAATSPDHAVPPTPEARGAGQLAGAAWAVHGPGAALPVWPPAPPLGPLPGRVRSAAATPHSITTMGRGSSTTGRGPPGERVTQLTGRRTNVERRDLH